MTTRTQSIPFRAVGFLLSSLGYATSRRFRQELAPLELEPREFALLRAIAADEGQSQIAFSERLQIPGSRMVALVDALEKRGFVERRQNPDDRRARALHLTAAGRAKLDEAFAVATRMEDLLCGGLAPGEKDTLIELLGKVAGELSLAPGVHAANRDAA